MNLFFKLDFGAGPALIGLLFLELGVVAGFGQVVAVPRLITRLRESGLIILGLFVMALPLTSLPYSAPLVLVAAGLLIPIAMGISFVEPALGGLGSLLCPPDRRGESMGVLQSAGSLGRGLGPILSAALYWSLGSRWTTALFALILAVLAWMIQRGRLGAALGTAEISASAGAK